MLTLYVLYTSCVTCIQMSGCLRAGANESKKPRNKKQETKRFSTFAVYRLRHSETKKTLLDSRIMFKRNMCETANQQSEVTWLCTWFPK